MSWQRLASLFPSHGAVLGGGLVENILVNTNRRSKKNLPISDSSIFFDFFMRKEGILRQQFVCSFFMNDNFLSSTVSFPVNIKRDIRRVSPVVIFCPTLNDSKVPFSHLSLSLPANTLFQSYDYQVYNTSLHESTEIFGNYTLSISHSIYCFMYDDTPRKTPHSLRIPLTFGIAFGIQSAESLLTIHSSEYMEAVYAQPSWVAKESLW